MLRDGGIYGLVKKRPDLLSMIFDSISEAIVLMGRNYEILAVNRRFFEIYGIEPPPDYSVKNILGLKCYEVLRGKTTPCEDIPCPVHEVLERGSISIVRQQRLVGDKVKNIVQLAIPIYRKGRVDKIVKIVSEVALKNESNFIYSHVKRYVEALSEVSHSLIIVISPEGLIRFCSKNIWTFLGYSDEEFIGKSLWGISLFSEESKNNLSKAFSRCLPNKPLTFMSTLVNASGEKIDCEVCIIPVIADGVVEEVILSIKPVRSVEEVLMDLWGYEHDTGKGFVFCALDNKDVAREAFRKLVEAGFKGIILSRSPLKDLKHLGDIEYYFISDFSDGEKAISPNINSIETLVVEKIRGHHKIVILIENIYYLVLRNSFKEFFLFLLRINDLLRFMRKGVVILSIGPYDLDINEKNLLREEFNELYPKVMTRKIRLSKDLIELLNVIREHNIRGDFPSQTQLCKEMNISKITMKKRLEFLEQLGLLEILRYARRKTCKITQKGEMMLKQRKELGL
jgi:PAS domain S-box-containing protein